MSTSKKHLSGKKGSRKPFYAAKAPKSLHERAQSRTSKKLQHKNSWLFGRHAVMAALTQNRRELHTLWVQNLDTALQKAISAHPALTVVEKDKKSFDTNFPQQVHQNIALEVGTLSQPILADVLTAPRLLMLDQITDPHNLGAILRSADAFGYGAVLIPDHNSAPITDIVAKTACGALETVPVIKVGNLNQTIRTLQDNGYWVVGLAGEASTALPDFTPPKSLCVVMGSEGEGLRRMVAENCDELLNIPMCGMVESLNVSVAAGITLCALAKK